jgi:hypothetical protein
MGSRFNDPSDFGSFFNPRRTSGALGHWGTFPRTFRENFPGARVFSKLFTDGPGVTKESPSPGWEKGTAQVNGMRVEWIQS